MNCDGEGEASFLLTINIFVNIALFDSLLDDASILPEELHGANTFALSNSDCTLLFWAYNINDGHICAFDDFTAACSVSSISIWYWFI